MINNKHGKYVKILKTSERESLNDQIDDETNFKGTAGQQNVGSRNRRRDLQICQEQLGHHQHLYQGSNIRNFKKISYMLIENIKKKF